MLPLGSSGVSAVAELFLTCSPPHAGRVLGTVVTKSLYGWSTMPRRPLDRRRLTHRGAR